MHLVDFAVDARPYDSQIIFLTFFLCYMVHYYYRLVSLTTGQIRKSSQLGIANETITTSDFVNAELDYLTDTETPRFCGYVVGSTSQGATFCTDDI